MEKNHLYFLWTNDNPITAELMVIMYSKNALIRKMWDQVTVIIWGATSKLVAENSKIQSLIKEGQEAGVKFTGCIVCATELGVDTKLSQLGIELIKWGEPLTKLIKNRESFVGLDRP